MDPGQALEPNRPQDLQQHLDADVTLPYDSQVNRHGIEVRRLVAACRPGSPLTRLLT